DASKVAVALVENPPPKGTLHRVRRLEIARSRRRESVGGDTRQAQDEAGGLRLCATPACHQQARQRQSWSILVRDSPRIPVARWPRKSAMRLFLLRLRSRCHPG